ncbi:MAG TPA: AAA family ATPase [Candidatus Desulfofervidus auxilii]|uniref:AAA family ATPase n=1 Tax=Desulfofervidus auxilii TaxID=1621989 RepID=A0A7V0IAI9_DESA2|nr:AAA family ATPase [Candidatus Desulfofervidus auxilii]
MVNQSKEGKLTFVVKEDFNLDGLLKVIILTEKPLSIGGYIALRYRGDECAALVDSIKPGKNLILIDPYLRLRLGCREGSKIEIEPVELQTAKKVEAFIPADLIGDETAISWIKEKLVDKPITEGLEIPVPILSLEDNVPVLISKVIPSPFAIFTKDTKIDFQELGKTKEETIGIRWTDIGGIGPAKEKVRELVEYPMRFPEVVKYLGLEPPKGILLYGPPGTGKTLIAKALASKGMQEPYIRNFGDDFFISKALPR